VVSVRASDRSMRQPELYHRMRDALAASLAAWFDAGGAIVEDARLAKDLHSLEWRLMPDGRAKVTDKETLRKLLGRSPDRYDALALAVWEPLSLREGSGGEWVSSTLRLAEPTHRLDPYSAAEKWRR
jgi:hypothetical protein